MIKCLVSSNWHDVDDKGVSAINCAFAGFVFDKTKSKPVLTCMECKVFMLNTLAAIDMMIEHASCSPACSFIKRVKGNDYFKYAIEIRNIALKKAGKPALNVKATDARQSLRRKSRTCNLLWFFCSSFFSEETLVPTLQFVPSVELDNFERMTSSLIDLSFPPLMVLEEASRRPYNPKLSQKHLLKRVQDKFLEIVGKGEGPVEGENSMDSGYSGSLKDVMKSWPPNFKAEESLGRCGVCLERPVNTKVVDCSHISLCSHCAPYVGFCPECMSPVTSTIKLYIVESGNSSNSNSQFPLATFFPEETNSY